jgi:tetratricopeptide (TPR) repeat protein
MTLAGSGIKESGRFEKILGKRKFQKLNLKVSFSLALSVLSILMLTKMGISGKLLKFDLGEKRYPSGAVAFIQKNKLPVNMFNLYNWGGYLVWKLYPDYRVFFYGRTLNETAFFHYNQIIGAVKGKTPDMPLWKRLLDAHNVNFILTSAVSSNGNIIPIVDVLYLSNEWKLVYADGKSMIFLKDLPANQSIIQRYQLSKEEIGSEIISECERGIEDTPATWGYYETLGYMYMKKNRFHDALRMFRKYLAMNPNNKNVSSYYALLRQYLNHED